MGLSEVRSSLLRLRAELASEREDVDLASVRREVDRLLVLVEERLDQNLAASAYERHQQLQVLVPAFETLHRHWSELRDTVAAEAAGELIAGLDISSGWMGRWGRLFDVAWALRNAMQESETHPARPASEVSIRRVRGVERRGPSLPSSTLLDLRYAGGLPLAQIGELAGLSPAAIQMRTAEFEERVLLVYGREAVERQVPEGWRLVPERFSAHRQPSDHLVLKRAGGRPGEVLLRFVGMKDDSDSRIGRPRQGPRFELERLRGRSLVLVVVLESGPVVLFLPITPDTQEELRSDQLPVVASRRGTPVLADAIARAVSEEGDMA